MRVLLKEYLKAWTRVCCTYASLGQLTWCHPAIHATYMCIVYPSLPFISFIPPSTPVSAPLLQVVHFGMQRRNLTWTNIINKVGAGGHSGRRGEAARVMIG